MSAGIVRYGVVMWNPRLGGLAQSLVLGFRTGADYPASSTGARAFPEDRETLLLANQCADQINACERELLQQVKDMSKHGSDLYILATPDPDGHGGFPGIMLLRASHSITDATLCPDLSATSDVSTLANPQHHPCCTPADIRDSLDQTTQPAVHVYDGAAFRRAKPCATAAAAARTQAWHARPKTGLMLPSAPGCRRLRRFLASCVASRIRRFCMTVGGTLHT